MLCNVFQAIFAKVLYGALLALRWKQNVVHSNFMLARPLLKAKNFDDFYRALLRQLSKTAAEFLFGNRKYKTGEIAIDETSKTVVEKMRGGGIFLAAHYGNYEAIGVYLLRLGIPLKASYAKLKPSFLNGILENRLRAVNGKGYSAFISNPRELLKMLDSGNLFCLVADQDFRNARAVKGKFLGHAVHCNPLPAFLLKHRAQTPVFICWITEAFGRCELHAKEITAECATPENLYRAYNEHLGELVQNASEFWFGFTHRRFRSTHPELYR